MRRKALHRQKPTTLEDGGKQPLTCAGALIRRSRLCPRERSRPKKLARPRERPFPRKPPAPARTHASSAAPSVSRPRPQAQLRKLHQHGAQQKPAQKQPMQKAAAAGAARHHASSVAAPPAIHRRDAHAVAGAARPCSAAAGAGIAAQPRLPHGSPSTPYSHRRRTAAALP